MKTHFPIMMASLDWITRWSVLNISSFAITFFVLSLFKNHIENHLHILKHPLVPLQGLLQGVVCHEVRWHAGRLDEVSLSLCWDACLPRVLADTRPGRSWFVHKYK